MKSYTIIAFAVLGLASAAPAAYINPRQDGAPPEDCSAFPWDQIEFTNDFPTQFCKGQTYDFAWKGGSGEYNLLQELELPHVPVAHWPGNLLINSTKTQFSWTAPSISDYPENTKWWFYVQDATSQPDRCDKWWDTSAKIPVVQC